MNSGNIEYRYEVERTDADRVRDIVASSHFFNQEEMDIAVELVLERLTKGEKSGYFFIFAEIDRQMVGYACFGPVSGTQCSFDLYWIAVDNDFRDKKIGKALLRKCEESIHAMGGHRIYVETSSRAQYDPTRAFYSNNAYELEAVLKDFYAPGDSKNIFVKEI